MRRILEKSMRTISCKARYCVTRFEAKSKEQINVTLRALLLLSHAPKDNFSVEVCAKTNLILLYRFAGRIFRVRHLWTIRVFHLLYQVLVEIIVEYFFFFLGYGPTYSIYKS